MKSWNYIDGRKALVCAALVIAAQASVLFGVERAWTENDSNFSRDRDRSETFSDLTPDIFIGPKDAPVSVIEFSDFQCPFCAKVSPTIHQVLKQYPGQVKWVFKHFPLGFHPDAPLAHEASLAAGAQGKFWEMHDLLFSNQRALKREDLIKYAKQLGLDLDRFLDALDSGKYRTIVEQDKAEGARLGVRGTPTFFINGRRLVGAQPFSAFASLIEKELRRLKVQTGADIEDRSGGISAKGPRDAPVTLAVFADFQSPLSAQAAGIVRALLARYPQQVRLLFKQFPLRFHPQAPLAHEAALAAGTQGKFWAMHDILFHNQDELGQAQLLAYAKRLGLDLATFTQALEEHRYRQIVRQDLLDGMNREVRGVPTFFINGRRLDGLQPVSVLQALIDEALARETSTEEQAAVSNPQAGRGGGRP